jgi:hypothetical protein
MCACEIDTELRQLKKRKQEKRRAACFTVSAIANSLGDGIGCIGEALNNVVDILFTFSFVRLAVLGSSL